MKGNKFFTKEFCDTVLYESQHFRVVPSLGSLIKGWVLITPKEEYLNFSLLNEPKYAELELLINEIKAFQNSIYGDTVIFEHGPTHKCSKTGCGVDYAHLHLVPCRFNLLDGFHKYLKIDLKWHEIRGISEILNFNKNELDYLYYRTSNDRHFITLHEEFPSQVFRKVIAHYIGNPGKYNWREFPELMTIRKTIQDFEEINVCHG